MPELPEVETVRKALLKKIKDKKIENVNIYYPNIIAYPEVNQFAEKIKKQKINDIKRIGKVLMIELDDYYLLSHLRMEGKYFLTAATEEKQKHEHIIFDLGDITLRYNDTRKFGRMYLYKKDEVYNNKPLNKIGKEPWHLTTDYLENKLHNKTLPIKTLLLDQSIIAGIGNIYADEILFLSNINPLQKANTLTSNELKKLINNSKIVLDAAIKQGGTTIRSYTSLNGITGLFQNELYVHARENKKCKKCNTIIVKIKVNGRGTYYCPNCQK